MHCLSWVPVSTQYPTSKGKVLFEFHLPFRNLLIWTQCLPSNFHKNNYVNDLGDPVCNIVTVLLNCKFQASCLQSTHTFPTAVVQKVFIPSSRSMVRTRWNGPRYLDSAPDSTWSNNKNVLPKNSSLTQANLITWSWSRIFATSRGWQKNRVKAPLCKKEFIKIIKS